jgi:hypothetical protein
MGNQEIRETKRRMSPVSQRSAHLRIAGWLVALLLTACSTSSTTPRARTAQNREDLPPFIGEETDHWLVEETAPVGRDDILPAFEASAERYGCRTEKLGTKTSFAIYGERRAYYGVSASCYEGTIALITLQGGSVRIGCSKPTTLQACDQLLRDISESR